MHAVSEFYISLTIEIRRLVQYGTVLYVELFRRYVTDLRVTVVNYACSVRFLN
jgi:hypothetical protein